MNKNENIVNSDLRNNLNKIVENGSDFKKGGVSGNSIEYLENGRTFCSLIYYDNEEGRDNDLKIIEEVLVTK